MPRRANADIEEIFRFIKEFIEREQYGPTYSELVKGLGMSRTTLVDRIRKLASEGRIIHVPYTVRGIKLPRQ